jgi:hypothetical protein
MAKPWLDKTRDRVASGKWFFNFCFSLSADSTKVPGGEVNLLIERFLWRASANDRPCAADETDQLPRARRRRVGKGDRGATLRHGACSAVPTAALLVGTADLALRINRNVGAAFAHLQTADCVESRI